MNGIVYEIDSVHVHYNEETCHAVQQSDSMMGFNSFTTTAEQQDYSRNVMYVRITSNSCKQNQFFASFSFSLPYFLLFLLPVIKILLRGI